MKQGIQMKLNLRLKYICIIGWLRFILGYIRLPVENYRQDVI